MTERIIGGCEYETVGNRRERKRREIRYDRDENESPSVAVATALAEYHGDDVTDTSTLLYEYIDPEALDALFAEKYDGDSRNVGQIQFDADGVMVVATSDRVCVYSSN